MIAAGVSLGIEITQFLFSLGFTDIDDLILNSLGGWVGAKSFPYLDQKLRKTPGRVA